MKSTKQNNKKSVPDQAGPLVNQHKRMAMGQPITSTSEKKKGK